ncbi:MAG: ABC transporter ATP-binding protein, partial [Bacteroidetes bacterium]
MYCGEQMEAGPVARLFAQPQHAYTRGLLACRPRMDLRLRRLPVVGDFLGEETEVAPPVADRLKALSLPPEVHAERQARLQAQPPLLQVDHLSKTYPGVRNAWGRRGEPVRAVDD